MKQLRPVGILAMVACSVCFGLSTPLHAQVKGAPVPFSAEWEYYDQGERQNGGQYYAGPDAVRVELAAYGSVHHLGPDGGPYAEIFNLKNSVALILDHTECTYSEQRDIRFGMYWSHWIGHFGSPCPQGTRARRIGRDALQGRPVEKWRCTTPARYRFVVWYDTRLQTPIRFDLDQELDEFFKLANIKEGPQPEMLFEPPPGYISHTVAQHMQGEHACPQ